MFDDLYYVGDKWVSSYLVKTSAGLVLIDSLESPYGHWIPESIEKLGLDPKEIKYILITHGHSDHVGSAEYLQSKYNAKVIMSYEDFILARSQSAKSAEESHFLLPSIDSFAKDDDELVVGEKTFKFYLTPGHTRGCLSIEFYVQDNGVEHRAFVVGGHGTNFIGLDLAEKYIRTIERIKRVSQTPPVVEVNLANHPQWAQLFERREKRSEARNPFIDSDGFKKFIAVLESRGSKKLQEEKSKASE